MLTHWAIGNHEKVSLGSSRVVFVIFLGVLIVRPTGLFGQVGAEEIGFREQT